MLQDKTESTSVTMKVAEAARIAGCGERQIRLGIAEGRIPHLRFGRNIVIPRSAFLRWIDSAGKPIVPAPFATGNSGTLCTKK